MYIFVVISLASTVALVLVLFRNVQLSKELKAQQHRISESRGELQHVFETSPDAVFVLEENGRIKWVNDRACEELKRARNDLQGQPFHSFAPAALQDEAEANLKLMLSGDLQRCEGSLMTGDQHVNPVEMTGRLRQMDGVTLLELHVCDITLSKMAEDTIYASRQLTEDSRVIADRALEIAEEASRAKSEFLASMSRDIRIPLNNIIGMGQVLADTDQASEKEECIRVIQQSSLGLLNVVENVLDIAKIESGEINIHSESLDLRALCKKLQDQFQERADYDGIQLQCRCDQNVPLYLMGDERLLEQVLVSLIGNALKYTQFGSVSLNMECTSNGPSGAGIYMTVSDTGIGISGERQLKIFDKFFNGGESAKPHFGNTGLGLAICKRQVELMGGLLGLSSSDGQGSKFFINLSLPHAREPAAVQDSNPRRELIVHRKGMQVLLAEDNAVNQQVTTALLNKAGCRVDAVDNGRDAFLQHRKINYDVVLMDCEMPVMDGFESTGKIRSMGEPYCHVPIIALTANAMKDDQRKCIDGGMNDYISKPIKREKLVALINKHTQPA